MNDNTRIRILLPGNQRQMPGIQKKRWQIFPMPMIGLPVIRKALFQARTSAFVGPPKKEIIKLWISICIFSLLYYKSLDNTDLE